VLPPSTIDWCDMKESGERAVPVLLAREGVHDGSIADALHAVAGDDEPGASAAEQHLPACVAVPECSGAGR